MENKKNATIVIVLILIVIFIIAIVMFKNNNKAEIPSPEESALNEAIRNDSVGSINESLDKINIEDNIDEELKSVDEDLKNL